MIVSITVQLFANNLCDKHYIHFQNKMTAVVLILGALFSVRASRFSLLVAFTWYYKAPAIFIT